jgi:cbb3-type cytochrome oxidase subunit 1
VWCLRAALIHLGVGFSIGGVMLAAPLLHLSPGVLRLRPLHAEMLLIGWSMQLVFGTAYWILPRFRTGAHRGHQSSAMIAVLLLNAGVLVAGGGQVIDRPDMALVGRGAETLAALIFAAHLWLRVNNVTGRAELRSP